MALLTVYMQVVIVAHANTLRSLVHALDGISDEAIREVQIPCGRPFIYRLNAQLQPVGDTDEFGFRGRFVDELMAKSPRYAPCNSTAPLLSLTMF